MGTTGDATSHDYIGVKLAMVKMQATKEGTNSELLFETVAREVLVRKQDSLLC